MAVKLISGRKWARLEANRDMVISKEGFMKRIVAFVILLLFSSAVLPAQIAWLGGSVDDALAQAKAKGKLLLLDFFVSGG